MTTGPEFLSSAHTTRHRSLHKQNPGDDGPFDLKIQDLLDSLQSNVFGPALIAQAFLPLLEIGHRKVIVNFTSGLASCGLDIGPKCTSYSISKSALNMLVSTNQTRFLIHHHLRISYWWLGLFPLKKKTTPRQTYKQAKQRPDLIAFVVDPGWVKTRTPIYHPVTMT